MSRRQVNWRTCTTLARPMSSRRLTEKWSFGRLACEVKLALQEIKKFHFYKKFVSGSLVLLCISNCSACQHFICRVLKLDNYINLKCCLFNTRNGVVSYSFQSALKSIIISDRSLVHFLLFPIISGRKTKYNKQTKVSYFCTLS